MDHTKQEFDVSNISIDLDTISIEPLTLSSLDSMLTTSADLSVGTVTAGALGSGQYILGGGTGSNVTWTTGTSSTGIGQHVYTIGPNTTSWGDLSSVGMTQNGSGKLTLKGEQADIDINGKSMLQWMQKVEERLNILTPNPELEKDWDDLRRLGERYRKLEQKCKQKAEMWNKLKSMPKPEIN